MILALRKLGGVALCLVAFDFCGDAPRASAADQVPLGMWSWGKEAFTTPQSRGELFAFCRSEKITHIDQHASVRMIAGQPQFQDADAFGKLVVESGVHGVTVSALCGSPTMFLEKNWERTLDELRVLLAFEQALLEDHSDSASRVSLWGIKYDVEPYLTPAWKAGGKSRDKVISDYLICLAKIRDAMDESDLNLKLCVDVPFWWDESKHTVTYKGKSQPFVHHIQDMVDEIGIMSYRRSAEDVFAMSEGELNHSVKHRKPRSVSPGLNLTPADGTEAVTTFAGYPESQFENALRSLRKKLFGNEAVRCVMIHDYRALKNFRDDAKQGTAAKK